MRVSVTIVLTLLYVSVGEAKADSVPCDFFQNTIVGTRCAATIDLSAGIDHNALKVYGPTGANQSSWSSQSNSDGTSGSFGAGWTPTHWFTLSFSSGYNSIKDSYSFQSSTYSSSSGDRYSYIGAQTLVGNVNLYDSGQGSQRLVFNAFVGSLYQPSFTANGSAATASSTGVYGGFSAFDSFRINQEFSITPSVSTQFDHSSIANTDTWGSSARVLVSNDHYGVALGPLVNATYLVNSDNTSSQRSSIYEAGGMLVYQPFRLGSNVLLNGLVLEGSALHSLGQAVFFNQAGWKSDAWSITGSAAFHFRY